MGSLRVAIVGAGLMGRWHAYYAARAGANVAAVVDLQPASAAYLLRKYPRARFFGELGECLASCPLDVVHVCTGLDSHVPLAKTALLAGKHVLVEKPVAPSTPETQHLLETARSQNLKVNPVHQFPFQRGFQRLLRDRDRLGQLVCVTFRTCSAGGTGRTGSERRRILLEILPHPLSLFRSLLGERVDRVLWSIQHITNDDLAMTGTLDNTQLNINLSLRGRPTCNELLIVGTEATGHVDLFHGYGWLETGGPSRFSKALRPFKDSVLALFAASKNLMGRTWRREWAYPGLRELIKQYYGSIELDRAAPIDAEEILAVARVTDFVAGHSALS